MLINPFKTQFEIKKQNNASINKATSEVVDILVRDKADLVNKVQDGIIPSAVLEDEVKAVVKNYGISVNGYTFDEFFKIVFDALFGYDILQPYIDDWDISDIIVNRYNIGFIKKFGVTIRVPINFGSEDSLLKYCYKVAAMNGGKINENNAVSVVNDRKRNLRIVISLKPINVVSPSITIRKPTTAYKLSTLKDKGMFDEKLKKYFEDAVKNKRTIVIAGQGGAGKSTLLGGLINEVPIYERGLFIQESYEIKTEHPNIICQVIRESDNSEVKNYTLFDLTKYGLLMSLDRIFIGELKDKEAFDFFNAIYTGHRGSMATIHANSSAEIINRLLILMKRSGTDISESSLREMLMASLDILVYMDKYRVSEISEVRNDGMVKIFKR